MKQPHELAIKSALDSWNGHIARTNSLVDSLTDEQLQQEVSPGRNTGVYLLGHLTAVHDRMLPLLGFEPQRYPHLDEPFLISPDKSGKEFPSTADLRSKWNEINGALATHFGTVPPEGWFNKHTSVSEEDFAKEPHRNRLSVLLSRTNHLAGHLNQMVFLKNK